MAPETGDGHVSDVGEALPRPSAIRRDQHGVVPHRVLHRARGRAAAIHRVIAPAEWSTVRGVQLPMTW
jgi:hypothetical protein